MRGGGGRRDNFDSSVYSAVFPPGSRPGRLPTAALASSATPATTAALAAAPTALVAAAALATAFAVALAADLAAAPSTTSQWSCCSRGARVRIPLEEDRVLARYLGVVESIVVDFGSNPQWLLLAKNHHTRPLECALSVLPA